MKTLLKTTYLFIAGLVMMLVGGYISITTQDYMASMNTQSAAPSINMLSDLRGMGGMLLLAGTYVLVSTFRQVWQRAALILATAVYASFVLFRSLSFLVDGMPEMAILIAYLIEVALAVLGIMLLNRTRHGNAGRQLA